MAPASPSGSSRGTITAADPRASLPDTSVATIAEPHDDSGIANGLGIPRRVGDHRHKPERHRLQQSERKALASGR